MRKSNIVIIATLLIVSLLLLWLWKYLGFSAHDPIDLTIAIVWWVIIAVIIVAICITEVKRRARIRTIFVADGALYNCETGVVRMDGDVNSRAYVKKMGEILRSLDFGAEAKLSHDQPRIRFDYIVRTKKYADGGRVWSGEVVRVGATHQSRNFSSAQDLTNFIAA